MKPIHALAALAAAASMTACAFAQETLPRRAGAVAESYAASDVIYTSAKDSSGADMRMIVTKPKAAGRHPAVFVAGWLSCDSIEAPEGTRDPSGQVFRAIAATGQFVLVRMDKAGVGDSEGDCAATDFDAELAGYRAAFKQMRSYTYVDPNKLFVFGISNGGGFAPLVAEGAPVAGFVTVGAWSRTWYEHMLDIERLRHVLGGKKPEEIADHATRSARLFHDVLLKGAALANVVAAEPNLRSAWDSDDLKTLYGRPVKYYQDLQRLNLLEAWSKVRAPALVLWGEYDWIMSRLESETIAAAVNANAPGAATFEVLKNSGHTMHNYPDLKTSFGGRPGPFDQAIAARIVGWLRERAG
jgi:pimeloyl-ACP methyl ester carboxylesterase